MQRALSHRASAFLLLAAAALLLTAARAPTPGTLHVLAAPTRVVLQPDPANGTDTTLFSLSPSWNFGDNASLTVGPNATTGDVGRSLLSFGLSSLPSNAVVLNATLSLHAAQGGGNVQVRQLLSPWTEGSGGHSWTVVPVLVRETAGVNRTLEPVRVTVPFAPNSIADPTRDLRVYARGVEVPSQVYRERVAGGRFVSADVYFDVTLGAFQSTVFDIVYSTNGTAVPAYRGRGFSASSVWTPMGTGGGASGATIADVDRDGRLEVVFGGTDGYVYCLDHAGNLVWRTLVSQSVPLSSVPFTPQVADMDRSGRNSIIAVTNDPSVVRLNSTGGVVWRYAGLATPYSGATLVDVNGDGVLDVLVATSNRAVIALDGATGALLSTSYTAGNSVYWPTIADLDGSGSPEILFASYDKNIYAYSPNGTLLWASAPPQVSFLSSALGYADLAGAGAKEIVTGDGGQNSRAFALYGANHTTAWSTSAGKGFYSGLAIGDLNGDGQLETVMGDFRGTMMAFLPNGQPLWVSPYPGTVAPGSPALADVTKDGFPEIIFLEGQSLVVLDRTGAVVKEWTVPANNQNLKSQYPMTNPAIADLNGNGTLDIVVPTGNGMEAFSTGGLDYDWRTWGYNLNHTQLALDGASGTGAPFLSVTLGSAQVYPAIGASWNYEDGTNPWSTPGSDFGPVLATTLGTPGWMAWNVTSLVSGWLSSAYPNYGLMLMEASEVAGALQTFASSDSPSAADRPMLTITYIAIAGTTPPQIAGTIPDMSRPENSPPWSIDLAAYATNSSTPPGQLRWNMTGFDPAVLQITGLNVPGNSNLTVTPAANRWGSNRVTYWLSDPQGRFDRQDAWLNLTPVNQPPSFSPPNVLYVRYNDTYTFDFGPYISDPDTPRNGLSLASDDGVHTSVSGFNVSFTYPIAYLDRWAFVNLTVSDGEFSVTRAVAVQVTADNPPVLTVPLPDVTLYEGDTLRGVFNLRDHFSDPNNDALYFSTGFTHVNVTIHANLSVDIQAPSDWWGAEEVTFRARDPTGAMAEDTITVTVLHKAQPPAIAPLPELRVRYEVPYSFNLDPYLSDPDTPVASLLVQATDPHVFVSGHLLTFLYPQSYNNTLQAVAVSVTDGVFTVSRAVVVAVGDDAPPVLTRKMPDASFPEGTVYRGAYRLPDYFSDSDGTNLFWSSGNRSVLVTIHPNGTVDLSAVAHWHGTERVTFRATDNAGGLQEDSVWITVVPVDQAPFFLPVPDQLLNRTAVYLPLSAYLGDDDTNLSDLVLVQTNSSHAMIIGQGVLLTYTANTVDTIQVVVSDGSLTNSTTIRILVALPQGSPVTLEILPGWLGWVVLLAAAAVFAAFVVYRRRQLEWAFLVTNDGLLVGSVSRRGPGDIDTDLMTGMLTTIMDFAKTSFSDEKERNLEGLELGEKRVAIVRGDRAYVAVVYRGRTPGRLLPIMRALLTKVEREHAADLGAIVDTSKLADIPPLLQKLVTRGNLPFVSFRDANA